MASIADIRTNLINAYGDLVPSLDLSEGTEERDIFVEAPIAGCLQSLYLNNEYNNKLYSPIKNWVDLADADIESYCANYNVTRVAATKSSGVIMCYTYIAPTSDINIDTTKTFSTVSTPRYTFKVTEPVYVSKDNLASYYNGAEGRWEFYVNVESVYAGSDYRAGAGTVTGIDSTITGIQACTNPNAISGGEDAETNESMINRVTNVFKSRGLYNKYGIDGYTRNFSPVAYVAEASDPLMQRDNGLGGCIDIYVKTSVISTYTESITITEEGLNDTANSAYSATHIILSKPPVRAISSVYINNVSIGIDEYSFAQDISSVYSRSTRALDKLVLKQSGSIKNFKKGDVIEITYAYNEFLYTITDYVSTTNNTYSQRDYLIREMIEAPIAIECDVQPATGYTIENMSSSWSSVIATYIDSLGNGVTMTKATTNQKINEISTIANVNISTLKLVDVNGIGVVTESGIVLPKNAYPVLDSVLFNEWVI